MPLKLFEGLRPFSRSAAARDVMAGVTLASMNIPQVLGYTRIAGTPVVTGLYTVLLPVVAFAVFGSSRHMVVAADSATAAIFSSSLSEMAPPGSEKYMALVGMVALLTAGFLLLARVLKLGFLADFLARTVLVGFLTGVGFQVAIAMLGDMLGIAVKSHSTLVQAWEVLEGLPRLDIPTLALSALVAAGILLGHRVAPRFPVALVAVVGAIAASAARVQAIALISPAGESTVRDQPVSPIGAVCARKLPDNLKPPSTSADGASRTRVAFSLKASSRRSPSEGSGRALYCRLRSRRRRSWSGSGRSVVNFQEGTDARMTTPFWSVTMTGTSTVAQDCSSCSRLTLTAATPTTTPFASKGEER